jgi:hypothetical protein
MTGAWSAWPEVPKALEELNIKDKAVTSQFWRLRSSLIAPPARSYEDQIVIRPVGESWEDMN